MTILKRLPLLVILFVTLATALISLQAKTAHGATSQSSRLLW